MGGSRRHPRRHQGVAVDEDRYEVEFEHHDHGIAGGSPG
jgi:hypothetical protein